MKVLAVCSVVMGMALVGCGDGSELPAEPVKTASPVADVAPLKDDEQKAAKAEPVAAVSPVATAEPTPVVTVVAVPEVTPAPFERYSEVCEATYEGQPHPTLPTYRSVARFQLDHYDAKYTYMRRIDLVRSRPLDVGVADVTIAWDWLGLLPTGTTYTPIGFTGYSDGVAWSFELGAGDSVRTTGAVSCVRAENPHFPWRTDLN